MEEERVGEAVRALCCWDNESPRVGIILGTGLGSATSRLETTARIPYADIPHFCQSTAVGHAGEWLCGRWRGTPVAVMSGRFHLYEGYSFEQIGRAIRVMHGLGVDTLVVTNAAGGLSPDLRVGDLVVIEDHVNFAFCNPRRDPVVSGGGPCRSGTFYDRGLHRSALAAAEGAGIRARSGVYIGVTGPNYETRAEYRFFRGLGDVVGMSTVPEATTAANLGMRVLGISTVTNVCDPDHLETTSGEEVAAAARNAADRVGAVIDGVLNGLS